MAHAGVSAQSTARLAKFPRVPKNCNEADIPSTSNNLLRSCPTLQLPHVLLSRDSPRNSVTLGTPRYSTRLGVLWVLRGYSAALSAGLSQGGLSSGTGRDSLLTGDPRRNFRRASLQIILGRTLRGFRALQRFSARRRQGDMANVNPSMGKSFADHMTHTKPAQPTRHRSLVKSSATHADTGGR